MTAVVSPMRSRRPSSNPVSSAAAPPPEPASGCQSPRASSTPTVGGSSSSDSDAVRASASICRPSRPTRRSATRRITTCSMSETAPNTKILLVEDDPNIVDLMRSNLTVRGFDTVVSTDGVRALQLLETERPDIILLDLMLPEVDGFELCRQVREQSSVGVIVVSARGGDRDKVAALNLGADDYMTKPFSIEE